MNFQSVICRFVPLLDVVLMLLGVLVLVMASAQVSHRQTEELEAKTKEWESLDNDPELVYQRVLANQLIRGLTLIYAETAKGANFDRCFLLDENGKPGREIPLTMTFHPSDIPEITPGTTVVLLISGAGFDSRWTKKRFDQIETTFEIRIIPLYNIDLRF